MAIEPGRIFLPLDEIRIWSNQLFFFTNHFSDNRESGRKAADPIWKERQLPLLPSQGGTGVKVKLFFPGRGPRPRRCEVALLCSFREAEMKSVVPRNCFQGNLFFHFWVAATNQFEIVGNMLSSQLDFEDLFFFSFVPFVFPFSFLFFPFPSFFLLPSFFFFFSLDAPSHLYKRVCPSVCPSVRPWVRPLALRKNAD